MGALQIAPCAALVAHCFVPASGRARSVLQPPCPATPQEGRGCHCRKVSSLAWLLLEEDVEGAEDAGLETFFFLLLTANGRISARFV